MYLVIIVCLSGLISSKIFLISGSNPISSIRSASSSTFNIKDIICDLNIQLGVKTETVKSAVYQTRSELSIVYQAISKSATLNLLMYKLYILLKKNLPDR